MGGGEGLFDEVTAAAAAPVIAKYTGVLAAADVFTPSTTFWVMESIRLDLGYGSQVHPDLGEVILMSSSAIRDPLADHLITPQNSALILIDYQPAQFATVRSMDPSCCSRTSCRR